MFERVAICFAVVANESKARPAASRMAVQKLCSDASESFSPRDANAENENCVVCALRAFVGHCKIHTR